MEILPVVKHIFQRKQIENNDKSIKSFFKNGISFPNFVSVVLNIDEEKEIKDGSQILEFKKSNNAALQFLASINPIFKDKESYLNNEDGEKKLLCEIITKQYYFSYYDEIKQRAKYILHLENNFFDTDDFVTGRVLLLLLNFFTGKQKDKLTESNKEEGIDKKLSRTFHDAKVPYFLNQSAFKNKNKEFFLIQMQIIYDSFPKQLVPIDSNRYLLKLINITSNIKLQNFSDVLKSNFIPQYVKNYLNLSNIENVDFSQETTEIITKNIFEVINFLKEKEKRFEILLFDFENPQMQECSIILFFRTFLNSFFLKHSRKQLFQRCSQLLFPEFQFKDDDHFSDLHNFDCYLRLINYLNEKNFNYNFRLYSNPEQGFEKAGIEMIVNRNLLKYFQLFEISQDLAFYQLQLIFDKFDKLEIRYQIEIFAKKWRNSVRFMKLPPDELFCDSFKSFIQYVHLQRLKKKSEKEIE